MTPPKCSSCGSGNIYVLAAGTIVCRACGKRTTPGGKQQ